MGKQPKAYKALIFCDREALTEEVLSFVWDGWELQGGVATGCDSDGKKYFMQVMVLWGIEA